MEALLQSKYGLKVGTKAYNNAAKLAQAKRNPQRYIWYNAKKRADRDNLEFDIEPSDITIPVKCPILGIKILEVREKGDGSPSLDRINNLKGYIKGNIRVISLRANRYKTDMTLQIIKNLYNYSLSAN